MPMPEQLIAEAREWVGTPFHANQMTKGVGADCVGVVGGAAMAAGIQLSEVSLAYPMRPNGTLRPYLERYLVRVKDAKPGDVLMMSFAGEPHHVALFAGETIIHAHVKAKRCIEQPMSDYWQGKIRGIYRFKEFA